MRDTQPMGLKYHAFFCCCTLFGSYPMSVVFILSYWKLPEVASFVYEWITSSSIFAFSAAICLSAAWSILVSLFIACSIL